MRKQERKVDDDKLKEESNVKSEEQSVNDEISETDQVIADDKSNGEVSDDVVTPEELLEKKVKELEAANEDLKDQMIRRQAEIENFRKRLLRDKEEAVQFANTRLIEDLLIFLDNLDRALLVGKNGGEVKGLVDGLEMAQSQLYSTLDKNWGLKAVESVGKEFDPQVHEACMMTVDESLKVETVLEEFQKGYTLHDRVIRPAKVKIGKPE